MSTSCSGNQPLLFVHRMQKAMQEKLLFVLFLFNENVQQMWCTFDFITWTHLGREQFLYLIPFQRKCSFETYSEFWLIFSSFHCRFLMIRLRTTHTHSPVQKSQKKCRSTFFHTRTLVTSLHYTRIVHSYASPHGSASQSLLSSFNCTWQPYPSQLYICVHFKVTSGSQYKTEDMFVCIPTETDNDSWVRTHNGL